MNVFKENILDGMIYTLHFQNFPVAAAHLMLTQMIGSEACSLEYVEQLYQKIDEKTFSLKKPHLLDFPDHVLENVVKELDGESKTIVRKTCKKLRSLVDNTLRPMETLIICLDGTGQYALFKFDNICVSYSEREGGCFVEFSSQLSVTERSKFIKEDVMQLVIQDLKAILINSNLKIRELMIMKSLGCNFCPEFKQFVKMFSSLEHKIDVKSFHLGLDFKTDDLMEVFKCMKPGTLESICLDPESYGGPFDSPLEKKIFNLPQWKEAKTMHFKCSMNSEDYIYLARYDKVILETKGYLGRGKITGKMILAMKNKLLKNENFDQLLIRNDDHLNPVKKLEAVLLPFKSPTNRRWAEFNYPNSDKKLMVRVYPHTIWLKGPCFESDYEIDLMMEGEDQDDEEESDEENGSDGEDTDEEDIDEEVNDEELTDGEETDVEDPDAEPRDHE